MPSPLDLFEAYNETSDEDFVSQNDYRFSTFKKYFLDFLDNCNIDKSVIHVTDIGAASGVFLSVLKSHEISGSGLEANDWLVKYGISNYGVDLKRGGDGDFVPKRNLKNIITYWDVLEHLPDPINSISKVANILEKNSLIYLSLPSTDSKSFKFFRWRWPMHLDVHLYYYNQKSLDLLFSKFGFQRIYTSKYWQRISVGYLILRMLRIFNYNRFADIDSTKFTRGFLNRIPITYSVGQRIYVYKKVI